jgi:hypothetical protein
MKTERKINMEIILYSNLGEPEAFMDSDEETLIYNIQGQAIAYLFNDNLIYSFKGEHLGWLEAEVLYDLGGEVVGSFESKCRCIPTKEMIGAKRALNKEIQSREEPMSKPKFIKTQSYKDLINFLNNN